MIAGGYGADTITISSNITAGSAGFSVTVDLEMTASRSLTVAHLPAL